MSALLKNVFFFSLLLNYSSLSVQTQHQQQQQKKKNVSLFLLFFLSPVVFFSPQLRRAFLRARKSSCSCASCGQFVRICSTACIQPKHTHTHAHFVIVVKEGKTRPQGCHLPTTSQQERGRLFVEVSVRYTSPHTSVYTHVYRRAEAAGRHKLNPVRHAATHPREEPST